MNQRYYTYDKETKRLTEAPSFVRTPEKTYFGPSAERYAAMGGDDPEKGAYPLGSSTPPVPPEGKIAVPDGYELKDNTWVKTYRFEDAPQPTLAEYDAIMEEHLTATRSARGYTTREPSDYLASHNVRWAQDAQDWVLFRDAVMEYALAIINEVAGGGTPPTLDEFREGLPNITWTLE